MAKLNDSRPAGYLNGDHQSVLSYLHVYMAGDRVKVVTSQSPDFAGRASVLLSTNEVRGDGAVVPHVAWLAQNQGVAS